MIFRFAYTQFFLTNLENATNKQGIFRSLLNLHSDLHNPDQLILMITWDISIRIQYFFNKISVYLVQLLQLNAGL